MRKLFTGLLYGVVCVPYLQAQSWQWAKNAGGGSNNDQSYDIVKDGTGNLYICGTFSGAATFGAAVLNSTGIFDLDIFLAKYDASGNPVWAVQAGSTGSNDWSTDLATDGTNVYVTGSFTGTGQFGAVSLTTAGGRDVFIAKYDNAGNVQWAKRAGGTGEQEASGIAADASGNLWVAGYIYGSTVTFYGSPNVMLSSAGLGDVFLARYNASGDVQWAKRAGGTEHDVCMDIVLDGSGNSFLTGSYRGTASFDATNLVTNGIEDIFIAKYDASGSLGYARKAGGTNTDVGYDIDVDGTGNVYVAGYYYNANATFYGSPNIVLTTYGWADIFTAKFNTAGNVLWAKRAGSSMTSEQARGLAVDGSGNVYVTGWFGGTSAFGALSLTSAGSDDVFVLQYNSSGTEIWARRAGGAGGDQGYDIALDASGCVFVTGPFGDGAAFDATTLTSTGSWDVFVARVGSCALPVVLLDFHGERKDKNVLLSWTTASETGINYFELEKSTDGILFDPITALKGKASASSGAAYEFTDLAASAALAYYRLKLVDQDGNYTYSQMVAVTIQENLRVTSAYVNEGGAVITLILPAPGELSYILLDITGRTIRSGGMEWRKEGENVVRIDMSGIPGGVYYLSLQRGEETAICRIWIE